MKNVDIDVTNDESIFLGFFFHEGGI